MIPLKIKEHLDNYIHQEVYVQISVIKGKEKVSTKVAIERYFNSNHFRDLSEGRPYDHFIDGLNDKCLIKLIDSPMKDKETDDEVIKTLQKKLKELSNDQLKNTFWEIETGEFVNNNHIKELEQERDQMIKNLDLKNKDSVHKVLINFCKKYEELCIVKYPDAPLPLEILKSTGS
jgi:vacuolar-type H+-ATPase subunit I/STV1